ncbi:30S ribosomal protein S4 [Halocatena salina]|uniref:Small ribosomal subunit protein uS4 n=1 Tax=Halocatena salina TaxID=2934340 RepID=A0A8U0A5N3_9EURY|nr:30S ribosomal protein S4 [Halocatena salina]UPM43263.1 30S ribosomal protein S4 [Halocatena salina]
MTLGKNTKFYETPNHPYQGERIAEESGLIGQYGLKNKEELWRTQSELRSFRREARSLLGREQGASEAIAEEATEFLDRLRRVGVLGREDGADDVLGLEVTDLLERRLQTIVYRKGLGNTPKQARQFITHGHITIDGHRVTTPSYTVNTDEEGSIAYDETSPIADELHPARAEGQE